MNEQEKFLEKSDGKSPREDWRACLSYGGAHF